MLHACFLLKALTWSCFLAPVAFSSIVRVYEGVYEIDCGVRVEEHEKYRSIGFLAWTGEGQEQLQGENGGFDEIVPRNSVELQASQPTRVDATPLLFELKHLNAHLPTEFTLRCVMPDHEFFGHYINIEHDSFTDMFYVTLHPDQFVHLQAHHDLDNEEMVDDGDATWLELQWQHQSEVFIIEPHILTDSVPQSNAAKFLSAQRLGQGAIDTKFRFIEKFPGLFQRPKAREETPRTQRPRPRPFSFFWGLNFNKSPRQLETPSSSLSPPPKLDDLGHESSTSNANKPRLVSSKEAVANQKELGKKQHEKKAWVQRIEKAWLKKPPSEMKSNHAHTHATSLKSPNHSLRGVIHL